MSGFLGCLCNRVITDVVVYLRSPCGRGVGAVDGSFGSVRRFSFALVYGCFGTLGHRNPKDPRIARGTMDFVGRLSSGTQVTSVNYNANNRAVTLTGCAGKRVANVSLFPSFVRLFGGGTVRTRYRSEMGNVINSVSTLPFRRRRLSLV